MFVLCALFIQINWNEKYKPQDMFSILLPRRNTFEIAAHIDGEADRCYLEFDDTVEEILHYINKLNSYHLIGVGGKGDPSGMLCR